MRLSDLTNPTSLATLFAEVRRRSPAPGVDGLTPESYARDLDERLHRLADALRTETWQPSALERMRRKKPGGGTRVLSIPTVEDRVVIEALKAVIEPEVEPLLSRAAFAYRPRRSAHDAVEAVAERIAAGATWIAQADIQDFFDSVRIEDVVDAVREVVTDTATVRLLGRVLARHARSPGRGLAQGSALSPLLSNLALLPMDRRLCAAGFDLVRYSDNLCIAAKSRPEADEALRAIEREVRRLGLQLKSRASAVSEARSGVLWLGFWLGEGGRHAGDGAVRALRDRVERAARGLQGDALRAMVAPIVHGWAQYFDAPLPEGVMFGEHDALVRSLLAERLAPPVAAVAGAPGDAGSTAGGADAAEAPAEGAAEAWDEDDWTDLDMTSRTDDLLAEVDRLAALGDYSGAESAYEEARRRSDEAGKSAPEPAAPPDVEVDDDAIDAYLQVFAAGQDCFEVATGMVGGRRDFVLAARPLTAADVRAHLNGRIAIAIRPRLADGTCTLGVLDIDAPDAAGICAARAYAGAAVAVAASWGWAALVEETGGRGMHVWIPIAGRPRADGVARALDALRAEAGRPREGVRVESLPSPDDAPDLSTQAITLPLGVHLETARRSTLRWAHGVEAALDLRGLFEERWTEPAVLLAHAAIRPVPVTGGGEPTEGLAAAAEGLAAAAEGRATSAKAPPVALPIWTGFGAGVGRVMDGCAVLRHLAEKAASVGHLGHPERLSLLYTLGHLGQNGAQAIHAIIGRCGNYDAAETSRQIAKLTGLPIGCTRMREKHATPDLMPLCCCDFGNVAARGGYATPLLHASGFRHAWRAVLRGRAAAPTRPVEPGAVRAVPEPFPEARAAGIADEPAAMTPADASPPAGRTDEGGVLLLGTPPHEWA